MATLYVHIGQPKTGTSAIQGFLGNNRELLESKGYCFPDFGVIFNDIGKNRNAHFLMHDTYRKNSDPLSEEERSIIDNCMNKISNYAKTFPNIIISDENIWRGGEKKVNFWTDLKQWCDDNDIVLKVIVYLRRQDSFIQSFWAQIVKHSLTITFEKYIKKINYNDLNLDYYLQLNKLSDSIKKDNIIVRLYEKNVNVVSDFLESIGLELTDEYESADVIRNKSLSGKYLEMKRLFNFDSRLRGRSSFVRSLLIMAQDEEVEYSLSTETHYLTSEQREELLSNFAEGNSAVAHEYVNKPDGVLFNDDAKVSNTAITNYSKKELADVCRKLILIQNRIISEMKEENNELFKNLKESLIFSLIKKIKRYIKPSTVKDDPISYYSRKRKLINPEYNFANFNGDSALSFLDDPLGDIDKINSYSKKELVLASIEPLLLQRREIRELIRIRRYLLNTPHKSIFWVLKKILRRLFPKPSVAKQNTVEKEYTFTDKY